MFRPDGSLVITFEENASYGSRGCSNNGSIRNIKFMPYMHACMYLYVSVVRHDDEQGNTIVDFFFLPNKRIRHDDG